ncbi:MAG: transcriptional regulator [Flavobacteriales bacterium]|nr:transcriptional regulator [Flavobacteriales bacterium]|tara:strand:+ start:492 stop:821 length:330 start_codon:yes stop_codon:yes gene_type:complete
MENRIQKIIDEQGVSLNAFAQEIGVNRSTISHILTGRNKPSVEVLQKILKRFPSLSSDWLLLGNGSMHTKNESIATTSTTKKASKSESKSVEKVVVFYNDNTFQEYNPS